MSSQISYDVDRVFGCFVWTGHADKRDGRAIIWRGRSPISAQRVVYQNMVGEIPEGLELDHTCRNPACVAPHHAEPVTRSENEKRKTWRGTARRKVCKQGHDLSVHGVVTPRGGKVCRLCNREALQNALGARDV